MSTGVIIGGIVLLLVIIGLVMYLMMKGGEDDKKVGPSPGPAPVPPPLPPPPPPPPPPVVVDVPQEFRTATNPWRIASKRAAMKNHNRGRLDSPQAWSAEANKVGNWYQMDNGKIADIVGVAIKGRKNSDQRVKTFKVKYYDAGNWKDVDGGATFTGNKDSDTQVEVKFAAPVKTRYIRIYPQTWNKHMSLRAGLITNSTLKKSELKLLNIPAGKRAASSWWHTNNDPNWHPKKGTLNSGTGWHIKAGGDPKVQWYEMQMDTPTKVAGVALQGRGDNNDPKLSWVWQWITTFTAKYKDAAGQWKDVDNGFVYSGVNDKDTTVWVPFNTPVSTTAIRIYPKTWHRWPTGRFDLLGSTGSSEGYEIGGYDQGITGFSF
jgi:hypothetical protein